MQRLSRYAFWVVMLAMTTGFYAATRAATLHGFEIQAHEDNAVQIVLFTDKKTPYTTQLDDQGLTVTLSETELAPKYYDQGFPIVNDPDNKFIGRAIPSGKDTTKIIIPNFPNGDYSVAVLQKPPGQAQIAPAVRSAQSTQAGPLPETDVASVDSTFPTATGSTAAGRAGIPLRPAVTRAESRFEEIAAGIEAARTEASANSSKHVPHPVNNSIAIAPGTFMRLSPPPTYQHPPSYYQDNLYLDNTSSRHLAGTQTRAPHSIQPAKVEKIEEENITYLLLEDESETGLLKQVNEDGVQLSRLMKDYFATPYQEPSMELLLLDLDQYDFISPVSEAPKLNSAPANAGNPSSSASSFSFSEKAQHVLSNTVFGIPVWLLLTIFLVGMSALGFIVFLSIAFFMGKSGQSGMHNMGKHAQPAQAVDTLNNTYQWQRKDPVTALHDDDLIRETMPKEEPLSAVYFEDKALVNGTDYLIQPSANMGEAVKNSVLLEFPSVRRTFASSRKSSQGARRYASPPKRPGPSTAG